MANTYNPYSDIKSIYDLKGQWDEANKLGDKNKTNQIAATAQAYYDKLKNNDYGGVATALSASNYQEAKAILDSYAPKTTTTTNTTTTKSPVETNNLKSTEVNRENAGLFDKYNETYNNLTKTNPFSTEEAKAILAKYDLAGLQARDNAAASGSATNGGNIDSYAAANALRQQASLVTQGQSAVLDAHQQKIDNVRGLLSDMGVNIDRVFNQDETSKNNETARLEVQANVTGYTPSEWVIKNDDVYNTYLNADGTFKKEKESVDIQALINSAKASGDTETANKLAVVRAKKILSNYGEFGKYANSGDISYMSPQETEARRQFDKQDALARETLSAEKDATTATLQNEIDKIKAETEGQKDILTHTSELQGNGVVTRLSEDAEKVAKQIQEKVNKISKEKYGVDVIDYKGRGTYGFTLPKDHVTGWWDDVVLKEILESPLTTAEKDILIEQLGFGDFLAEFNSKYKKDATGKYVSKSK